MILIIIYLSLTLAGASEAFAQSGPEPWPVQTRPKGGVVSPSSSTGAPTPQVKTVPSAKGSSAPSTWGQQPSATQIKKKPSVGTMNEDGEEDIDKMPTDQYVPRSSGKGTPPPKVKTVPSAKGSSAPSTWGQQPPAKVKKPPSVKATPIEIPSPRPEKAEGR